MIYTPELIKSTAPSIFATSPSSKMTNKYEFVPTDKIMEFFDREGWEISSVKQNGRGIHDGCGEHGNGSDVHDGFVKRDDGGDN